VLKKIRKGLGIKLSQKTVYISQEVYEEMHLENE